MIVITTPTGTIGRQVLENLLDTEEALRVIARDPSGLSADARDRVDVIEGSHDDAAVVHEAFASAEAVFWLAPPDPRAPSVEAAFVGFTRPAANRRSSPHSSPSPQRPSSLPHLLCRSATDPPGPRDSRELATRG